MDERKAQCKIDYYFGDSLDPYSARAEYCIKNCTNRCNLSYGWKCPQCNRHNYSTQFKCPSCGQPQLAE